MEMIPVPDIKKLASIQEVLDNRVKEEHGIDYDVTNLRIIAFKTEFGELLNEHKFFKFWKKDCTPNTKAVRNIAMMEEDKVYYNPLLEEYVDGVHFLLGIGNERKYIKYIHAFDAVELDSDNLEYLALEIFNNPIDSSGMWLQAMVDYLYFGHLIGFTPEQIEEEYLKKNKINHERQNNGY